MSTSTWYVRLGDQVLGPISDADLRDRAVQGSVTAQTPVSSDGTNWMEAAAVTGIVFTPSLPPMAPPSLPPELHHPAPVPIVPASPPSKWQIAGWFILTRAGRVTQYALMEAWAVICDSVSDLARDPVRGGLGTFGPAGNRVPPIATRFLGEQMYRGSVGAPAVRESIRALDDQIEKELRGQAIGCKAPRQTSRPAHRPCCHISRS